MGFSNAPGDEGPCFLSHERSKSYSWIKPEPFPFRSGNPCFSVKQIAIQISENSHYSAIQEHPTISEERLSNKSAFQKPCLAALATVLLRFSDCLSFGECCVGLVMFVWISCLPSPAGNEMQVNILLSFGAKGAAAAGMLPCSPWPGGDSSWPALGHASPGALGTVYRGYKHEQSPWGDPAVAIPASPSCLPSRLPGMWGPNTAPGTNLQQQMMTNDSSSPHGEGSTGIVNPLQAWCFPWRVNDRAPNPT